MDTLMVDLRIRSIIFICFLATTGNCISSGISLFTHEGDTTFIPCLSPLLTVAHIYWTKNGIIIDPLSGRSNLRRISSGLLAIAIELNDAGKYSCYSQDSENRLLYSVDLDVLPSVRTSAALRADITPSGSPMAGESLTLTCSLTGGDSLLPTVSYQWRRGESVLTNSPTLHFDSLYLSDAGQYSCLVTLSSTQLDQEHTLTETYDIEFNTLHIQVLLDRVLNCMMFIIVSERTAIVNDIASQLSRGVEELCGCGFSSSHLSDEFIDCFEDSPDRVTYRAVLVGTENASVVNIASLISEWVSEGGSIIVQSTRLELTSSCPVVIADRDSPECPQDITNRPLTSSPSTTVSATTSPPSTAVNNIGAVVGGVLAGVLAIAVIVLVIVVIVLLLRGRRSGSKDINDGKTNIQQTNPPRSPDDGVVLSELRCHDYEDLSKVQEEVTYEQVDQSHPPTDYQLTTCAAYAPTHFNNDDK